MPRAFNLSSCARSNILALDPYRCARDDYKDNGTNVLLDANENAYGPSLDIVEDAGSKSELHSGRSTDKSTVVDLLGLNRYPDPHQIELKQLLCNLRNTPHNNTNKLRPENLFVGNGSDEAIDGILRCFCVPGQDKILTCPPTYGMYAVNAQVNDLQVVTVPLDATNSFDIRTRAINNALSLDHTIKIVFICSPGNPTAKLISQSNMTEILEHPTWNGIVVLDEAYIDFSPEGSSLAEFVTHWPNLIVMQTLSKAFGLAGIRLGAAFTSPDIARLLNKVKAPYNISSPTSALACSALQPRSLEIMKTNRGKILKQRERMLDELPLTPGIGRFLGGKDANFLLVEILDKPRSDGGKPSNKTALAVYERLAETKSVVVRFRGQETGCLGCLRITVGTEKEIDQLLLQMKVVLDDIFNQAGRVQHEEQRERRANNIIA